MLYLLDASVCITASNSYYPIDGVPEFWDWLLHQAGIGLVKMPLETYEEIIEGGPDDALVQWLQLDAVRNVLVLQEQADQGLVAQVVTEGYAPDLKDDEIPQMGRDPFLISYALVDPADRYVVTAEVSKPSRVRQNRHIPDVCNTLGIQSCNLFALNKALGFRTGWNSGK